MKKLRVAISLLLTAALLLPAVFTAAAQNRSIGSEPAVLDFDGEDGYTGDYVVIYNPSVESGSGLYTGGLTGIIKTDIDATPQILSGEYEIDIDSALLSMQRIDPDTVQARFDAKDGAADYQPGDTRLFTLNNYSPLGSQVEFKLLARGEHCYVWTPTSTAENVYPLDSIDESYGQIACDKFDSCYPLLAEYLDAVGASSTGNRISLLYYNIDDGWVSGQPYVGGFFSSADSYSNGIPVISLDTYPGVYHPTEDGGWDSRFERSFGIAVHEYQHMVNYLRVRTMDLWLNEAMSSAAEEFCYPGSCLVQRIPGWVNTNIIGDGIQQEPPREYEYTPEFSMHTGASMYSWNDNANDVGALYGRITLFSQYLYTHYGNGIFRQILLNYKSLGSASATLKYVTGVEMTDLVRSFQTALTVNDADGEYSFAMQDGYDPAAHYGVENLYDWLAPVVYTGEGLTIYGGGAVTVKPVGGTYYPPEDADEGLVYIGIDIAGYDPEPEHGLKGDVDGNGVINANDSLMILRYALGIISLDEEALWRADVDGNGLANANDSLMILRYALGIITQFPAGR